MGDVQHIPQFFSDGWGVMCAMGGVQLHSVFLAGCVVFCWQQLKQQLI